MLILLLILVALGFLLSWVAGFIGGVEISVGSSVMALITNGIVVWAASRYLLPGGLAGSLLSIPVSIVVLGALVFALAEIKFREGVLIAVVFSVILWGVMLLLTLLAAGAAA